MARLHSSFEIDNSAGLSEVRAGKALLSFRETRVPNLCLLPAETAVTGTCSSSTALGEIIKTLRAEFKMILIDTPPTLQMPDVRVLGRHADAMILVIRAARTSRDAARLACARLADDGVPLLGTILTDWNVKSAAGYAYGYGYESQKYYSPGRSDS